MPDTIRRTVTITEGRASCTIVEADNGAVLVRAQYTDGIDTPFGNLALNVSAPDRQTARAWCVAMMQMLREMIERGTADV